MGNKTATSVQAFERYRRFKRKASPIKKIKGHHLEKFRTLPNQPMLKIEGGYWE